MEVGTNHRGEMAALFQLVQPQFGVITNIGREHLEFWRPDGVAQEEGALAEALPASGKLFSTATMNFRCPSGTKATVVRVGLAVL